MHGQGWLLSRKSLWRKARCLSSHTPWNPSYEGLGCPLRSRKGLFTFSKNTKCVTWVKC
ncbi:hypothetical protein DPMN_071258 [Dreissena polymorpha]|uniref:Uncharacterized protein n=1 Tax=Dreissena polymorpha TaxID=45954 RepID=A0A9D4BW56_DREPO|nr:hypothetical protein DPMN_071258 [Dreissena polymorpha]